MDSILIKFEHFKEKNSLKAIHLIKKAIKENPDNFAYLEALGKHLCSNKEDKEGIKYLKRAEKISELDPNVIFILAISLMRIYQFDLAIKQFHKINHLYPEAYYNAALCYIRKNQIDKAIDEAKPLLQGNILAKEALRLIIDILAFSDVFDKVKAELENYKKQYGEDDYYHYLIGNDFFEKGNFLESAYHLSKIKNVEIERIQYYKKYAHSLYKIKNYKKAEEVYQEILELGSPFEIIIFEYCDVLYKLGKYQKTIDVLNEYKHIILNKAKFRELRSRAYYKLNLE